MTYFTTKDELLNRLRLELKEELRQAMLKSPHATRTLKDRLRYSWQQYVHWGVMFPDKRKVLAQLGVSDRITEQSKAAGMRGFAEINA